MDITSSSNVATTPPWAMEGWPRTPGLSRWKRVIISGLGFGVLEVAFEAFPAADSDVDGGGFGPGGTISFFRSVKQ